MESTEGHLVLDTQELHDLCGLSLVEWNALIGFEIEHKAHGLGKILRIEESGQRHLRVEIHFTDKTRRLSSAFLGTGSLLIVRPENEASSRIRSRLMTRVELAEHKRTQVIELERAAEEARKREEQERRVAEVLDERLAEEQKARERRDQEEVEARQEFADLRERFGCGYVSDERPTNLLFRALKKRNAGEPLDDDDIREAERQRQYEFVANWFEEQFKLAGDPMFAARASSYWRKAKKPENAIAITDLAIARPVMDVAAVWTSRGAAFADMKLLEKAETCAHNALTLEQKYHPYNLLGRVNFLGGNAEQGLTCFRIAKEKGSPDQHLQSVMEHALKESGDAERRMTAHYLFDDDPVKYGWAKKYL